MQFAQKKLIEIRNLAQAQRPSPFATQLYELAKDACGIQEDLKYSNNDVSNYFERNRKRLITAEKRLRTHENLAEWRDCEIYRLRGQVDAILQLKGMTWRQYEEAQAASRAQMDWSDAGSTSTSPRGNDEEGKRKRRRARGVSI